MVHPAPSDSAQYDDLLIDIIETLEVHGLPSDSYQLGEFVDVEALGRLLDSSASDVEVQLTVDGRQLLVTEDEVEVLFAESAGSSNQ